MTAQEYVVKLQKHATKMKLAFFVFVWFFLSKKKIFYDYAMHRKVRRETGKIVK